MKEFNSIELVNAGNDIYYFSEAVINIPKNHLINGKTYFRFCDFIFIPELPENLSDEQVKVVNRIRLMFIEQHPDFTKNKYIRERFLQFVNLLNPTKVLEIGPGINPLLNNDSNKNIEINLVEFDEETIIILNKK